MERQPLLNGYPKSLGVPFFIPPALHRVARYSGVATSGLGLSNGVQLVPDQVSHGLGQIGGGVSLRHRSGPMIPRHTPIPKM